MNQRWDDTECAGEAQRNPTKSFHALSGSLRKPVKFLGTHLLMGLAVAAGVIGLIEFGFHLPRSDRTQGSVDGPHEPGYVGVEVIRIWLPQSLDELAKSQTLAAATRSHQEFRRFLERRSEQEVWYAFTRRWHQPDGQFVDCTFIRHPYDEWPCFQELREVLATAAGNSNTGPVEQYADAAIVIVPVEFRNRDPNEVIGKQL